MPDLTGREIFATGKWNGLEFDERDLDDIVTNFQKLADNHKVPLKFGHNDKQPITDGQPAIGWVTRVYRQGKKLLADFADVPNTVAEAIKRKLYRTVSVELLLGVEHKGQRYNHVLDAVALLGADQPAVNTLQDLDALMASRTSFSGGRAIAFETMAGKRQEEDEMSEELSKKVDKLLATVETLTTKIDEKDETIKGLQAKLKKADEEKAEFDRKQKDAKVKAARKAVTDVLDEAVKNKTMTPAIRETYAKQLGVDDDEQVLRIDLDDVKAMCSATRGPDGKETGMHAGEDEHTDDPGEKLFQLTRESMAKTGEDDFAKAFSRTAAANPKLHREYLDSNGIKGGAA